MPNEISESPWKSSLVTIARWLLRIVVLAGAVVTLWIVVGTICYPEWWYAAIVGRGLFNASFVIGDGILPGGFAYLVLYKTWLLFCMAGICLAAVVATVFFPLRCSQFIKALDRWARLIIAVCLFLLFVDSIVLLRTGGGEGAQYWLDTLDNRTPTQANTAKDFIFPPIDFYYLDSDRVAQIYSEIEPDLVEQKRTLSNERKSGESAGVEVGGATLKAEASSTGRATSEYQRTETTSSRKCIELMNFTLRGGSTHYYTTMEEFYRRPDVSPARNLLDMGNVGPELKALIDKEDLVAKEKEGADKRFAQEARGFVIVEGSFHVIRANGAIKFEEEFSPKPNPILFRFVLPASKDGELFRDGRRMHVFGDVTQQLDSQGVIEIHPLAVF